MIPFTKAWKEHRAHVSEMDALETTIADVFGRPSLKKMREWDDERLHGELARNHLYPAERSAAESLLRQREAWAGPSGASVRTARWALGIAILSLLVSATVALGNAF
jgi:hypothetical protein